MQEQVKKSRDLSRVWKPFSRIQTGEFFYIGKTPYQKRSRIHARRVDDGDFLLVWNIFRRYRTTELVRGNKSNEKPFVPVRVEVIQTVSSEPNNDNNVGAPTS